MQSIAYVTICNATTGRSDDPAPITIHKKIIQSLARLLYYRIILILCSITYSSFVGLNIMRNDQEILKGVKFRNLFYPETNTAVSMENTWRLCVTSAITTQPAECLFASVVLLGYLIWLGCGYGQVLLDKKVR
jgi:hypothetical protein